MLLNTQPPVAQRTAAVKQKAVAKSLRPWGVSAKQKLSCSWPHAYEKQPCREESIGNSPSSDLPSFQDNINPNSKRRARHVATLASLCTDRLFFDLKLITLASFRAKYQSQVREIVNREASTVFLHAREETDNSDCFRV